MQRLLRLFYRPRTQGEREPEGELEPETRPNSRPDMTHDVDRTMSRRSRPSALDLDLPPLTTQPPPPLKLEPFRSIFATEIERDYSHLSGLNLLRALLTDNKTIDRSSFYYLYVISTNNQTSLNKIIDQYSLSKFLWGPGKREIYKSKSFKFGHLKLLKNIKDEYVEKKSICKIQFENESCAKLAIGILKFLLHQHFKEIHIEGVQTNEFECFNNANSSDDWIWEEFPEKGMVQAQWLSMKKPKNFLQWNPKVHFQSEQNISPLSRSTFLETKLEINQFSELLTLETTLETLLSFELLSKPLPNQLAFSKLHKKCQFVFPDTVACKITYLKVFKCLKEVKEKSILDKLGICTDVLIPDQSQLEHDDHWKIWDDCIRWDAHQILTFAQSICQPTNRNTPTVTSNTSTRESEFYDPAWFKLPKKWQFQIVLATNLPIIQEPISTNLRSFLFQDVIRPSKGFSTSPYSVHLGSEGGSRFRTMILIFYKPNSSRKLISNGEIKLEPDGEILRGQLKEVCDKFNSTEHSIVYRKRKIKWQYIDLAYSSNDRLLQYELYKELIHPKTFKLMMQQLGPNNSPIDPSNDQSNDLRNENQLRYGNLFAIPGGFKDLSRRHRGRTNSNAATLLDDYDDVIVPTDSENSSESDDREEEEEVVLLNQTTEQEKRMKKDYKAIKEQLEDEIFELECKKDESDENIIKSLAFQTAQSVSEKRKIEIEERKRLKRQRRRRKKKRKINEDENQSEESNDQEEGEEIDWEKKKKRIRKIRGMNDQEDEIDSTGIITNPNFITNTEAIARRHARPLEREPGAVL